MSGVEAIMTTSEDLRGLLAEVSGYVRSDPDLYGRIAAALAIPVPAAPAGPVGEAWEIDEDGTYSTAVITPGRAPSGAQRAAWCDACTGYLVAPPRTATPVANEATS